MGFDAAEGAAEEDLCQCGRCRYAATVLLRNCVPDGLRDHGWRGREPKAALSENGFSLGPVTAVPRHVHNLSLLANCKNIIAVLTPRYGDRAAEESAAQITCLIALRLPAGTAPEFLK